MKELKRDNMTLQDWATFYKKPRELKIVHIGSKLILTNEGRQE
jgi:hypothetical protein